MVEITLSAIGQAVEKQDNLSFMLRKSSEMAELIADSVSTDSPSLEEAAEAVRREAELIRKQSSRLARYSSVLREIDRTYRKTEKKISGFSRAYRTTAGTTKKSVDRNPDINFSFQSMRIPSAPTMVWKDSEIYRRDSVAFVVINSESLERIRASLLMIGKVLF